MFSLGKKNQAGKKDGPGQVAHLVTASSWYAKFAGSIPGQGTYKNQPMNV